MLRPTDATGSTAPASDAWDPMDTFVMDVPADLTETVRLHIPEADLTATAVLTPVPDLPEIMEETTDDVVFLTDEEFPVERKQYVLLGLGSVVGILVLILIYVVGADSAAGQFVEWILSMFL